MNLLLKLLQCSCHIESTYTAVKRVDIDSDVDRFLVTDCEKKRIRKTAKFTVIKKG